MSYNITLENITLHPSEQIAWVEGCGLKHILDYRWFWNKPHGVIFQFEDERYANWFVLKFGGQKNENN